MRLIDVDKIPIALIVLLIVANFIYIVADKIDEWIRRRKRIKEEERNE